VGLAAVKILVIASVMDQSDSFSLFGWACCLFNPKLVQQPTVSSRHCLGRILHKLGVGKLPPAFLLLASWVGIVLCIAIGCVVFKPSLDTISDVMPEEYFPSDHLMLMVKLEIRDK
jgi:hypothetical protein